MKKWLMLISVISVMALLVGCSGGTGTPSEDGIVNSESVSDAADGLPDEDSTTDDGSEVSTKETVIKTVIKTIIKTSKITTKWTEKKTDVEDDVELGDGYEDDSTTGSSRRTVATSKRTQTSIDDGVFPVTPPMSIKDAAKSVVSGDYKNATKITSDYYVVSPYNKDWAYTHHPGLTVFKDKLYYSYSCGYLYEDAPGQQGVVRSAPLNDLSKWSEPMVAAPSRIMENGKPSYIIPSYLFVVDDTLYLYYMEKGYALDAWENNGEGEFITTKGIHGHQKPAYAYYRAIGTKDGVNWDIGPFDVGFAANESPRLSKTGTWFAGAGNMLLTYTGKDQTDPDFMSWEHVGMTDEQYQNSIDRETVTMLTESSWYQTDDYVIHQMHRCHDGLVWMCESYDNGKTWTEAYPTNFKSDTTMAKFGSLPDGRYYAVANPEMNSNPLRFPMSLFISKDGYDFGKVYTLRNEQTASAHPETFNWTKIGAYAYPEVLVHGDYMYIAHSQFKEVMSLTRVKLSDIK